jgi:hypothetical protein
MTANVRIGQGRDALLLTTVNRLRRMAMERVTAGADLDKHDGPIVQRDDIEIAP